MSVRADRLDQAKWIAAIVAAIAAAIVELTWPPGRDQNRQRGIRRLLVFLLSFLLWTGVLGGLGEAAGAEPLVPLDPAIPALRDRQQELERQQQELQRQQKALEQQQKTTQMTGDRLQRTLQDHQGQRQGNQAEIDRLQTALQDLEATYAKAEQTYHGKRLAIVARLRFLQRQSTLWGFAVLMQSQSLERFLERRAQIERVYEADRARLGELDRATRTLAQQRDRLKDEARRLSGQALDLSQTGATLQAQQATTQAQAQAQAAARDRLQASQREQARDSALIRQLLQQRLADQARRETLARQEQVRLAQARQAKARADREAARALAQLQAAAQRQGGQWGGQWSGQWGGQSAAGVPLPGGAVAAIGGGDFDRQAQALGFFGNQLRLPVLATVSSGFGWREHPILGTRRLHQGADFSAPYGATIRAAHDGTVVSAGWLGGYGYAVIVDRGDGLATLYGHASELFVQVGQKVLTGDALAAVGSTGLSTGPHLHFEVRLNGEPVDPLPYLRSPS